MSSYKRLYRSRSERMLAGVAGGLGEYFNIDPTLMRLLFVVGAFLGGPGLLAYIILWVVVPEEPFAGSAPVMNVPPPPPAEPFEPGGEDPNA